MPFHVTGTNGSLSWKPAGATEAHKVRLHNPKSLTEKILDGLQRIIIKVGITLINYASQRLRGENWFEIPKEKPLSSFLQEVVNKGEPIPSESEKGFERIGQRIRTLKHKFPAKAAAFLEKLEESDKFNSGSATDRLRLCHEMLVKAENEVDELALEIPLHQAHTAKIHDPNTGETHSIELAKEKIDLIDTVPRLLDAKKKEKTYFEKKHPSDTKRIGELSKDIEKLEKTVANGKLWVTADDYRNDGANHIAKISNSSAKDAFIPAHINQRLDTIKAGDKNLAIVRGGGILDPRQGARSATPNDFTNRTDRGRALEDQMLQLIQTQVERHPELIKGDAFTIFQTSVAAPNKEATKEKKEMVRSEKDLALDMQAVFDRFQGKTLIFDGEGPFIDNEDNVHLGIKGPDDASNPLKLTLNTVFVNVAVQLKTDNTGTQFDINRHGMNNFAKLIRKLPVNDPKAREIREEFTELRAILDAKGPIKGNPYDINVRLILLADKFGAATGVNCFSGKDRTGYLIIKLKDRLMEMDAMEKWKSGKLFPDILKTKGDVDRLLDQARRGHFHEKQSAALAVVKQNTGHNVLKVTQFSLIGVNIVDRIGMYIKGLQASV